MKERDSMEVGAESTSEQLNDLSQEMHQFMTQEVR